MYIGSIWLVSPRVKNLELRVIQETLLRSEGLNGGLTKLEGNAIHCRWLAQDQWTMQEEMKRVFQLLSEIV